jgi:hypothetical protein
MRSLYDIVAALREGKIDYSITRSMSPEIQDWPLFDLQISFVVLLSMIVSIVL